MFTEHTEWTHRPCFYVTAADGNSRYCLLAGPYQTRDAAIAILDTVLRWAVRSSGDPQAERYDYAVIRAYNGYHRSILGILAA